MFCICDPTVHVETFYTYCVGILSHSTVVPLLCFPQDLNVRLVEEISKTRGAKYCSVDSAEEFRTIMNQVDPVPTTK